jgi:hypothetical protein
VARSAERERDDLGDVVRGDLGLVVELLHVLPRARVDDVVRQLAGDAVGSLDGGALQTLTETVEGLGSAPDEVPTGNSPVTGSGSSTPWAAIAAGLAGFTAVASGAAVAGRRVHAARHA